MRAYKVEWSDGENETFKRSVLGSVPNTLRVPWGLDSVQLLDVLDAESQEIDGLQVSSILATHSTKLTSAAASISACQAFFPCPNMVAAMTSNLYFPAIKSAALRKIAALSAHGISSHSGLAFKAPSIAAWTVSGVAE